MKVWVCEPSVVVQQIVLRLLRESEFEWHLFEDPRRLPAATGPGPDLICIGLDHPLMNGVDLARQLRRRADCAVTPIVLVAAGGQDAAAIERAVSAGVTEVFYTSNLEAMLPYLNRLKLQAGQHSLVHGHVLLVEDSASAAQLISKWLRDGGFTVHHEVTAEAALSCFCEAPADFDIVVTDFLLAGQMTGLGLVRGIRDSGNLLVPILVVSSFDDATRKIEILSTGANDYVTKPVVELELLARVRILARNKQLIEEIETQRHRLFLLATRDQLTGLHNRHSAWEQAAAVVRAAGTAGLDLGVVMVDIDHFKSINDRHGHAVGDRVLSAIGREILAVLQENAGERGLAARMGGEEFLVMMESVNPQATAEFSELLRARIAARQPEGLVVTASLGFANLSQLNGSSGRSAVEALYEAADNHLYAAKAAGRNCVHG